MEEEPIAKEKAVQCFTLGRWFNSLSSHLTLVKAFLSPARAVERLSCGWWCSGLHSSWFHGNRIGQGGYQNLAFGLPFQVCLCEKLQVLPTPVCALLCIHGRCADYKDCSSLHNTKDGALNWMKTPPCKHHSSSCNVYDPCSPGDHRAKGCCVTGLVDVSSGAVLTRGGRSLPVPGKSAPACCQPAGSGSYWRRLKHPWCPTEDNKAIFFSLLSNGHLSISQAPLVQLSRRVFLFMSEWSYRWQIVGGAATSSSILPV